MVLDTFVDLSRNEAYFRQLSREKLESDVVVPLSVICSFRSILSRVLAGGFLGV